MRVHSSLVRGASCTRFVESSDFRVFVATHDTSKPLSKAPDVILDLIRHRCEAVTA